MRSNMPYVYLYAVEGISDFKTVSYIRLIAEREEKLGYERLLLLRLLILSLKKRTQRLLRDLKAALGANDELVIISYGYDHNVSSYRSALQPAIKFQI